MKVLVAGGAGYIGSHVCKMLLKKGYDVIIYDNLSHGYEFLAKYGKFIIGDIGDRKQLEIVFKNYKPDVVMHFCAYIEVGESVQNPRKYYENNLCNTLNLIHTMLDNGINKIIFSSTAAVYGMPENVPIDEEEPKNPINPYGRTKWMVEQVLKDYSDTHSLKYVAFRYFNAAGADPEGEIGECHEPETHLIPLVLDAAMGIRKSIKIFGTDYPTPDGTCIRDYIHVNDLASAHIKGVEYLMEGNNSNYFNLGNGKGFSVREIINTVKNVTKKDFAVEEVERRPGDPAILIAKSNKAKNILKWEPEFGIEDIISHAWKWHQKIKKSA
ncbi:MAG: UDP-glucose 4-epimerase GalE [Brevinematales bacterium]|nr:UDP-glucose 4-epimerase GalE [Brevinematales bacterium]